MQGYLLDTNLLSELVRKRPSPSVLGRLESVPGESLSTSSVCVAELRYGALRHPQGRFLWERLASEVLSRVRIIPLGRWEALFAGEIRAALADQGSQIGIEDILIGATGVVNELIVVTRNVRHFDRIVGLHVESWWEE